MWSLWNDGAESGEFGLNINDVIDMIDDGAELSIEAPDEYELYPEDEM